MAIFKHVTIFLICFSLLTQLAFAQGPGGGFSLSQEITASGIGSEYVSGNYPGAVLMSVNLWGSVTKPGIHHIPTKTDLITLISLAGGPQADAELDKVTIKRRAGNKNHIIQVDAEELLENSKTPSPILEANDIVVIPRNKPVISSNTMTTVSFVGSILSIVLAGIVLSNQFNK